jgi:hypothetical protein
MPVAADVIVEAGVVLHHRDLVNLYGCRIGAAGAVVPARLLRQARPSE